MLNNPLTSILVLTKLIELLTSFIQVVLPARLNCRFLQMKQVSSLTENLSYLDKIVLKFKNRTEMVGTKLRTVQWLGAHSTICRGVNTNRCLNKGLGGNVQWNLNRGDVVCSGKEEPHKRLRTLNHKFSYTNVLENLEAQSYSSPG